MAGFLVFSFFFLACCIGFLSVDQLPVVLVSAAVPASTISQPRSEVGPSAGSFRPSSRGSVSPSMTSQCSVSSGLSRLMSWRCAVPAASKVSPFLPASAAHSSQAMSSQSALTSRRHCRDNPALDIKLPTSFPQSQRDPFRNSENLLFALSRRRAYAPEKPNSF
jgi:hypothetical protein